MKRLLFGATRALSRRPDSDIEILLGLHVKQYRMADSVKAQRDLDDKVPHVYAVG